MELILKSYPNNNYKEVDASYQQQLYCVCSLCTRSRTSPFYTILYRVITFWRTSRHDYSCSPSSTTDDYDTFKGNYHQIHKKLLQGSLVISFLRLPPLIHLMCCTFHIFFANPLLNSLNPRMFHVSIST